MLLHRARVLTLVASVAWPAALATPITLPGGHYYMTLDLVGQTSASNSIPLGTNEGAWGVVIVDQIDNGKVVSSTIVPNGTPFFHDLQNGGNQIAGTFYGLTLAPGGATATGGFLDLYWYDVNHQSVAVEAASGTHASTKRTSADNYVGFTQGTLLLHAAFASGCSTTVATATLCLSTGQATGYLNVLGGMWAGQLDSNFFTTASGAVRDINSVMPTGVHNAPWDVAGTDIVGFSGTDGAGDPITGLAIPEPATAALTLAAGAALVASRSIRRRRCLPAVSSVRAIGGMARAASA